MFRKYTKTLPEWSRKILAFRQARNLTQGELGKRLKTSAMAVSRWERGNGEPPADAYIRLGNIADDPLCWFFWERAGLSTADVMRVLPTASRRLRQGRIATVQLVHAGAVEFTQTDEFRCHSDSPCPRGDSRREIRGSCRSRPAQARGAMGSACGVVPKSGADNQSSGKRQFDVAADPGRLHYRGKYFRYFSGRPGRQYRCGIGIPRSNAYLSRG